jgi:exosome complex RNA-binding protein Csl4
VREVRRFARQLRDRGVLISGCSLCARLTLKPGVEQAPCPVCGEMVTR